MGLLQDSYQKLSDLWGQMEEISLDRFELLQKGVEVLAKEKQLRDEIRLTEFKIKQLEEL